MPNHATNISLSKSKRSNPAVKATGRHHAFCEGRATLHRYLPFPSLGWRPPPLTFSVEAVELVVLERWSEAASVMRRISK